MLCLVDDIIDTAGTITKAAEMLMEKGAASVRAIATHPILSGKAFERLEKSAIKEIIVSDTIPLKAGKQQNNRTFLSTPFCRCYRKGA